MYAACLHYLLRHYQNSQSVGQQSKLMKNLLIIETDIDIVALLVSSQMTLSP